MIARGKAFPNFFIIGAPKCGTTALYEILRQHPEIYMSSIKEPHFFTFEGDVPIFQGPGGAFFNRVTVKSPLDYLMLFSGATSQHRAIGEASPSYLRSEVAARRIFTSAPSAKIIVLLRQPVDRAYSHFQYLRYHGVEPISDFSAALAEESSRKSRGWSSIHFYHQGGLYADNLRRYYELFPRTQIKVYLYEQWNHSPQSLLQDLFKFLDVDDQFVPEIRRSNVTLIPRFYRLNQLTKKTGRVGQILERVVGEGKRDRVLNGLQQVNRRFNLLPPPTLDVRIRRQLTDAYREDIIDLQNLICCDLTHWLEDKPSDSCGIATTP